jgi:hypothetical protein
LRLDPSLRLLLRLQARGRLRELRVQLRTVRGVILGLFTLFMLGAVVFSVVVQLDDPAFGATPENRQRLTPLVLLAFFLISIVGGGGDSALGFQRAEVGLLFPAPLSRRQLVSYKLISLTRTMVMVSPFLLPGLVQTGASRVGALLAALLLMPLINLWTAVHLLLREALADRTGVWRAHLLELLGWLALVAFAVLSTAGANDPWDRLDLLLAGPLGWTLLLPGWFAGQVLSGDPGTPWLLVQGSLGLIAVQATMFAALLIMDERFIEAGIRHGERLDARMERFARGGGVSSSPARILSVHVPMLPRWGGAGTLAWTSLVTAARTPGVLLTLAGMGLLCSAFTLVLGALLDGEPFRSAGTLTGLVNSASIVLITLPHAVRLDFRGEVDRLPVLRGLPIAGPAVVAGLLTPMWLMLWSCHAVLIAWAAVAEPLVLPWTPALLVAAALVDAMFLGTDNALYLVFPSRLGGRTALDMGAQQMVLQVLGTLANGLLLSGAVAAALGVWWATGSPYTGVAAGLAGLAGLAVTTLVLTVIAYDRFDPSTQTPA